MHRHLTAGLALAALALLTSAGALRAETPLPPKPARHLLDQANVIPAADEQRINAKLEQFERDTSNQVLVAVFPKIPEGTYLEDFTVKTAEAWGAGGKKEDNGIILFAFIADRKLRIEDGYGLEGVVPDSIAKNIIDNVVRPRFKEGNYAAGIDQGVDAIVKATRGEYKGTGRTRAASRDSDQPFWLIFLLVPILFLVSWINNRKALMQNPRHRHYQAPTPWWFGGGGGGFGGGGGGGFSSGGGGGFSGGGGSFGGGGASGGW